MIYVFFSNNPSSGDINLSNLSCHLMQSYVEANYHEHLGLPVCTALGPQFVLQ